MLQGLKNMAARMDLAEDRFLEQLVNMGGIDNDGARRVLAYYRKNRLVKRDAVGGTITVKHGALLDRDVIQRAAAL